MLCAIYEIARQIYVFTSPQSQQQQQRQQDTFEYAELLFIKPVFSLLIIIYLKRACAEKEIFIIKFSDKRFSVLKWRQFFAKANVKRDKRETLNDDFRHDRKQTSNLARFVF